MAWRPTHQDVALALLNTKTSHQDFRPKLVDISSHQQRGALPPVLDKVGVVCAARMFLALHRGEHPNMQVSRCDRESSGTSEQVYGCQHIISARQFLL